MAALAMATARANGFELDGLLESVALSADRLLVWRCTTTFGNKPARNKPNVRIEVERATTQINHN